jgi:hypothetical protein
MRKMITRTAGDPKNCARRMVFTNSARVAWKLILGTMQFKPGQSILVPAYVGVTDREGSGIIDPVDEIKVPYTLYPVGGRLQVDLDVVERMLATGRHPLMLVVHYFGFTHVDLVALRGLCDRNGTLLVEDCAHVAGLMEVGSPLGTLGHAAFYSLHKSIAVRSGGALRVNDDSLGLPDVEERDRCPASVLEQYVRTDMAAVIKTRRANYQWLAERLADDEGLSVLYPNLGTVVPHDFPVLVHDGLREKLYFALMEDGLPTIALYYRLIASITLDEFPLSHALSRGILNLPVHQDTTIADLEYLTGRLRVLLAGLRA